jgi:FixJ family two-component response regulator
VSHGRHYSPAMDGDMSENLVSRGEMFVVDREPVHDALCVVLSAGSYRVLCFADGATLRSVSRTRGPSCIPLDLQIPRKPGLEILKEHQGHDSAAPGFMISGHGDVAMALKAIKNGALDFIEKPLRSREIVSWLDQAIGAYARRHPTHSGAKAEFLQFSGRETLTRREREVLAQFASGASNKEAGRQLGISPRTVEDHRANIMKKLGARNAADLIRIVMTTSRAS